MKHERTESKSMRMKEYGKKGSMKKWVKRNNEEN